MNRPSKHAHWRVRDVAVEMGYTLYDHMMHNNEWYKYWRDEHPDLTPTQLEAAFVEKNLFQLLPQARAVLAKMLTTTRDEKMKDEIYEALLLDATLTRGRLQ